MSLLLPRPKRFLYFLPLPFGVAFIYLTTFINKAAGLYGVLALFVGANLTWTQIAMYMYSLICLGLLLWVAPGILGSVIGFTSTSGPTSSIKRLGGGVRSRRKSGRGGGLARGKAVLAAAAVNGESDQTEDEATVDCVLFAWLYLIDFVLNAAFTAWFGLSWYLAATAQSATLNAGLPLAQVNSTETATFPTPPAPVLQANGTTPGSQHLTTPLVTMPQSEAITSITIIALSWLIRTYFIIIVLSFVRSPAPLPQPSPFPLYHHPHNHHHNAHHHHDNDDLDFDAPPKTVQDRVAAVPGYKARVARFLVDLTPGFWGTAYLRHGNGGVGAPLPPVDAWLRFGDSEERGLRSGSGSGSSGSSVRGD
ncbi:Inositolphosphorylceramide synthase subunit Kei1-domain-containing protein [Peziza echinospora]|nr:Inositolphosphorylceramide synthase subunit Kei1-domain-containing protein [Peziza echinospora]